MSQTFTVNIGGTLTQITVDVATETTLQAIADALGGTLVVDTTGLATEAKQDSQIAQIGEVQASPTQYTILDRLKAIYTALTGTLSVSFTWLGLTNSELRASAVDVNIVSGGGSSTTQYADGAARGTATGTLLMLDDGTNIQAAQGTVSGVLKVDGSEVTQPVSGTFWQATQPVSLSSVPSHDVTNAGTFAVQAAQYGSWTIANTSFQVTQSTAANLNATVIGTGTFLVQAEQSGAWNIGSITTLPALPTGSNTIGAISNTSFGISGTLPAFASTPTVNAAQSGTWTISNTTFAATQSGSWNVGINAGSNLIGKVNVSPDVQTATDKSGTITTGGIAQNAIASNANRKGWVLQNTSDTDMYVSDSGTASASSFLLKTGASARSDSMSVTTGAISLYCATTGKTFAATEYT